MSTNVNTRVLELIGSVWKEVKKAASCPCFAKSDLINRISLAAIKQGISNCCVITKKQIIWLAQKISTGSGYLYNIVVKKVASVWESIIKPPEFTVSFADDRTQLSFFSKYRVNSYSSFSDRE
ncbi:hypothetical protein [Candidatus Rhabdochlamydia sp. T3358]|uniref:hypothetical protein n=1 Tax=Candidatus Rhabdochlamydia sp. T3358 TaxID=2099795 RepID=UPI0010BB84B3|nr:hypothetical protein [Candidatus Rhabdochlamydia sp. T3358]VHO03979.1 hypothetical protein RHT_01143 [Candidatus Rhabdochlamydia sp. T3358]